MGEFINLHPYVAAFLIGAVGFTVILGGMMSKS
jgi:hypothetical protein